eukprot:6907330-Pyramimonas_sp.AAC.1
MSFERANAREDAPWNEAADVLANARRCNRRRSRQTPPELEWAWVENPTRRDLRAYPRRRQGNFEEVVKPQVTNVDHMPDLAADIYSKGSMKVNAAQCNAQSMAGDFAETDLHLDTPTKGALVGAQLAERKVHIAGLQETRCKEAIWTGR